MLHRMQFSRLTPWGVLIWLGLVQPTFAGPPTESLELSPQQVQKLGIETATAQATGQLTQTYPAQVVLPPDRQWLVTAPAAGLVQAMTVREGDAVRSGQPLVRLHSTQAQNQGLDWQAAKSQADQAHAQWQRDQALFQAGLITQARLESSRTQVAQAQALETQRRLLWQEATGGRTPTAPQAAWVQVSSPGEGLVLEQMATLGQRVEAMAPLYRIGKLHPIWLDIQVPVQQGSHIAPGTPVSVLVANTPGTPSTEPQPVATGRITGSGATVHAGTQTVRLFAQVANPDLRLRPGQLTQATLTLAGTSPQVRIPSRALMTQAGRTQVFITTQAGRYRLQEVAVLAQSGTQATVTGLPANASVVVKGTAALQAMLTD